MNAYLHLNNEDRPEFHEPTAVERLASWGAERFCLPAEWITD